MASFLQLSKSYVPIDFFRDSPLPAEPPQPQNWRDGK